MVVDRKTAEHEALMASKDMAAVPMTGVVVVVDRRTMWRVAAAVDKVVGAGSRRPWASRLMVNTRFRLCSGIPYVRDRIAEAGCYLLVRRRLRWTILADCRRLTEDGDGDTVRPLDLMRVAHCSDGVGDRWEGIEMLERKSFDQRRRRAAVHSEVFVTVLVRLDRECSSGQGLAVAAGHLEEDSRTVVGLVGHTVNGVSEYDHHTGCVNRIPLTLRGGTHNPDAL